MFHTPLRSSCRDMAINRVPKTKRTWERDTAARVSSSLAARAHPATPKAGRTHPPVTQPCPHAGSGSSTFRRNQGTHEPQSLQARSLQARCFTSQTLGTTQPTDLKTRVALGDKQALSPGWAVIKVQP